MTLWSFVPLNRSLNRQDFDCGKPALNKYLQVSANQHQKSNISKTTVALPNPSSQEIAGYYTLNASKIDSRSLPKNIAKKLPKHLDIPSIKIGQLAVDKRYAGQGLGEELLINALHKCYTASTSLAVYSVIVDAHDDDAKRFWLRYGFIQFEDQSSSLFLPIKTVQQLLCD